MSRMGKIPKLRPIVDRPTMSEMKENMPISNMFLILFSFIGAVSAVFWYINGHELTEETISFYAKYPSMQDLPYKWFTIGAYAMVVVMMGIRGFMRNKNGHWE